MTRTTIREALAQETPLVTPLAHDALSARLIEQAGFKAFAIGGSALLAARHAYPDIGLIGLTDMVEGIRDIAAASSLPFFADADDGYGDVKSVARTIAAYEAIGVRGLLLEDQSRDHKQQRADKAAAVVEEAVIEAKLRTALGARRYPETFIIGRTDAYGPLGLDAAMHRAERFLSVGADGIFIAGLRTEADYRKVGAAFKGAYLSAAMFEGGDTPWLSPAELGAMGFTQVSFPASIIFRVVAVMQQAVSALRRHAEGTETLQPLANGVAVRGILDQAVNLDHWRAIETPGAR
ncbi:MULTISPECIES: isocitrate lyase/PEP mutase family protein [unclassified Mesorhizobium]|uniref:isocitrate lyase/PEP mutase family protein n=1 Tax=unclassified Mesorhizobium TaxID=325217 RepID=UPI0015E34509|nr:MULTISPECIES: isocitrate lyase/PEP mutase family protein [unclassified Mesorhizobium]MCA0008656.1 isocitrate lyase/PEP mutase family protein [Mesorhizobium sp. B264B1B]MCA0019466.1 isocitrate lyase/PEP mutase family protein [Mesorhizobium sp. B264B1A]MCA0024493.1 isocitrate lyase/PEP mutase family protein [Mesorhizobium sp. B263B1A]MCA0055835.1 isocitrate lyase/PEP mutase family protein [Mesorhizobium sp. B261B1A]UCI16218.1 isocitrate lyase/PEP mutase family protein [Mesorhizobium sp. B2-1-